MEAYAQALLYAIPFFVILLLIEVLYGYFVKNQKYTVMDTVSSLSSGLTNIVKDSLGLGVERIRLGAQRVAGHAARDRIRLQRGGGDGAAAMAGNA